MADTKITLGINNKQALASLAQIENATKKVSDTFFKFENILGGLALGNIIANSYQMATEFRGMSSATVAAANAQDNLNKTMQNFQTALLNAIEPLNNFLGKVDISVKFFQTMLEYIINIGLAVASVFGAGLLLRGTTALLANLDKIGKVISGTAATLAGSVKVIRNHWDEVGKILGPTAGVFTKLKEIAIATALVIQKTVSPEVAGRATKLIATLAGVAAAAGTALSKLFSTKTDQQSADANSLLEQSMKMPGFFRGQEEIDRMNQDLRDRFTLGNDLAKQADMMTLSLSRQNTSLLNQLYVETQLIGKQEDYAERARAIIALDTQRRNILSALQDRLRTMSPEEQSAGGMAIVQRQIAEINAEFETTQKFMMRYLNQQQTARMLEQDRLNIIERITEAYDRQVEKSDRLNEILGGLRGGMALGSQGRLTEIIRQYAELFGGEDGMSPEDAERFAQGVRKITAAFDEQEKFRTGWEGGWKRAFQDFTDNALNAASFVERAFGNFIGTIESAIDSFVRTGKFSFKDFTRSIVQDLASESIKAAFRRMFIASTLGKSIGGAFAGFFAEGGYIPPGKFGVVGEQGPELVSGPAQVTPMGGGGATVINNYISAIDAKSVAQLFSENRKTLLGVTEQAKKELNYRGMA